MAFVRAAAVRHGIALRISLICACAESPSFSNTTDESSSSGSSSSTGGTDDAACACVSPPFSGGALVAPTCGSLLCETHAVCPSGGTFACLDDPNATHDEASLSCALEALVARTPGYIEWSLTFSNEEHTYQTGYVVILDDGRAITQSTRFADFLTEYRGATLGPLPPQEDLDACAASTSPAERFECLAFVPDEPQVVCDPPW